MCSFDVTVQALADAVAPHVRFKNAKHAGAVARGRALPMDHPITRWVHEEAERLYDFLQGEGSDTRAAQILADVGISDPKKGRACKSTQVSALREAIRNCANLVASRLRKKGAVPVVIPVGVSEADFVEAAGSQALVGA